MTALIELRGAPAEIWFDEDRRPERLVANAKRFFVVDTPTPLSYAAPDAFFTHPPAVSVPDAWRFTAREYETGEATVLDVVQDGDHWTVAASYV